MAKMDWKNSDVVKAEDMNQIGQEINQLHTELKDRLDTADTDPVTLQPGVQVVHATKDARFRLGEMKGRTLINLSGNSGDFEFLSGVTAWQSTLTLDSANKTRGSYGIKVTVGTGFTVGGARCPDIPVFAGRYYVIVGDVKNGNATSVQLQMPGIGGIVSLEYTGSTKFTTVWRKFSPTSDIYSGPTVLVNGLAGTYAYADEVRVYEISAAEYAALDNMTSEQIAEKYPFVPSGIVGVENPYVIGTSDNLLPPFYEWTIFSHASVVSPYVYKQVYTDGNWSYGEIEVVPNTDYYLSFNSPNGVKIGVFQAGDSGTVIAWHSSDPFSFNSGNNSRIRIVIAGDIAGTVENPMLVLGTTPKPFKPRRDTMLALQTELNANPIDGSNPDVLFKKDGQYFKLAKWKKVVLDGLLPWEYHTADSGYKVVRISGGRISGFTDSSPNNKFVTKYNGARLPWISESGDEGAFWNDLNFNGGSFLVAVLNKDSGWGELSKTETFRGDGSKKAFTLTPPNGLALMPSTFSVSVNGSPTTAYTYTSHVLTFTAAPAAGTDNVVITYRSAYIPTSDEIKAYFNGWVMTSQETWNTTFEQYNGLGTKGWLKRYVGIGNPVTSSQIGVFERGSGDYGYTLPSTVINSLWTPYQLLYRLAKDPVEPVSSEGALSLHEGNNLIEVGTGIVLREKANPNFIDTYKINDAGASISWLRYATNRILSIYKDSQSEYGWEIASNSPYGRGGAIAVLTKGLFDPSVVYSVTYIKLDRSPVQPISGSVAATEKAQLVDLTADVAEALQRVSVVEQKKAEKDVPLVWITPTLLNGWKDVESEPLLFTKVGRRVQLTGRVTGGLTSNGVVLFRLPAGYRTLRTTTIPILYSAPSNSGIGELVLGSDGSVMLYGLGGNEYVDCSNITFLAEY